MTLWYGLPLSAVLQMSATAAVSTSSSSATLYGSLKHQPSIPVRSLRLLPASFISGGYNNGARRFRSRCPKSISVPGRHKSSSPAVIMEWQDCAVKMEVDVPASVAYSCYSDRLAVPRWMPFISSVENLEGKPDLSRWSLKYQAFGRDIEFSWLSRNMQPIPNQKIQWTSLEGLPNRGDVRFYPKGASSCTVELTVSYEVPQILIPVASALQPFLKNLLLRGLERFAEFAKDHYSPDATV